MSDITKLSIELQINQSNYDVLLEMKFVAVVKLIQKILSFHDKLNYRIKPKPKDVAAPRSSPSPNMAAIKLPARSASLLLLTYFGP